MFLTNPVLAFVIAALATWRLSHLIASEDGPFRLSARWRAFLGRHPAGELFACFPCLSLWLGIGLALLVGSSWKEIALLALALSGSACLLNQLTPAPVVIPPVRRRKSKNRGEYYDELLRQSLPGEPGDYDPIYELDALRRHPR